MISVYKRSGMPYGITEFSTIRFTTFVSVVFLVGIAFADKDCGPSLRRWTCYLSSSSAGAQRYPSQKFPKVLSMRTASKGFNTSYVFDVAYRIDTFPRKYRRYSPYAASNKIISSCRTYVLLRDGRISSSCVHVWAILLSRTREAVLCCPIQSSSSWMDVELVVKVLTLYGASVLLANKPQLASSSCAATNLYCQWLDLFICGMVGYVVNFYTCKRRNIFENLIKT